MKEKALLLLFGLLSLAWDACARDVFTIDNLPNVHLQDETRYTINPSGVLTAAAVEGIDALLYRLERETGIECVVAALPSIGEADCFDFCHELLNRWGVGKRDADNGLIVLLVVDQRCVQFYTGYGLEGVLPDAICKRIQLNDMLPLLKEERWSEAMTAGIKAVVARVEDSGGHQDGYQLSVNDMEDLQTALVILLTIVILCIPVVAARRKAKCPQCGKHKLMRTHSQLLARTVQGMRTERVTYTCRNCGHRIVKEERTYDPPQTHHRGGGGPIIFGGGMGGGSFGGGTRGGSFGGGRGGGGGAGTRF